MRKSDRLFRCSACKAEATFTPGPTGGGGHPRCACGGDLIRVKKTRTERQRSEYEDHLGKCDRCKATVAKRFWGRSGLCPIGRRMMDDVRRAGDAELSRQPGGPT